jgi:hypothetical protein
MRGTGRAVSLTGLQQTNSAGPSSWLCLCDQACFGSRLALSDVRAVHHDGTMSAVQWGTVSTWVAGIGTVAAASPSITHELSGH